MPLEVLLYVEALDQKGWMLFDDYLVIHVQRNVQVALY